MKGSIDSPSTQQGARGLRRSILLTMLAAVTTMLAALPAFAGSDAEQFARFKDATQWGAPAGDLNQTRYSSLKDINTGNAAGLSVVTTRRTSSCSFSGINEACDPTSTRSARRACGQ